MAVRPLRDGGYAVETDGDTYVVDLDAGTCTCPDSRRRGANCKHRRRVAIEVTTGLVPRPDERESACAVCGRRLFVPLPATGPQLCARHDRAPGDRVRDREDGSHLLVVRPTGERADRFRTGEGRPVADYDTNADYGPHEPVFECVYLDSLDRGASTATARRYAFPASRLVDPERRSDGRNSRSDDATTRSDDATTRSDAAVRLTEPPAGTERAIRPAG